MADTTLQKLKTRTHEYHARLAAAQRNVISEASTLAIEIAETQREYIAELESKNERLTKENLELMQQLEIYRFKERDMKIQLLREQFPSKRKSAR